MLIAWFLLSLFAGFLGRRRVMGFVGFFLLSLFLSPVVTLLWLLISYPSARERQAG